MLEYFYGVGLSSLFCVCVCVYGLCVCVFMALTFLQFKIHTCSTFHSYAFILKSECSWTSVGEHQSITDDAFWWNTAL